MLRRLGIRAKVLAVLAVPMIVLLAAGAYISYDGLRTARSAAAAATVVEVLEGYAPLGVALQQERALSVVADRDREQLDAARAATDAALAAVKPLTARVDFSQFPSDVVSAFQEAQLSHNESIGAVRDLVDSDANTTTLTRGYNTIIQGQISLVSQIADSLENRELGRYVGSYHALMVTAEDLVNELALATSIIRTQGSSDSVLRSYATQTASTEISRDATRVRLASLGQRALRLPVDDPTSAFNRKRALVSEAAPGSNLPAIDALTEDVNKQLSTISEVSGKVLASAKVVAAKASSEARNTALVTIAIAVLAALASFAFAIVVSRGIVNPLRRLTGAAQDVRDQLPKLVEQVTVPGEGPGLELVQIPVDSSDEVGQLAAAFNSVNATTLQVAQEQAALRGSIAEMFVNVARRDQVLLNRQLSFIDSLERAEEDPNTLANLFRLDHLATRMRRNAESLLVLAGIDSGRRVRDAMPLSDVIRTASSEIEQYDRIELDLPVDPLMHGFNALGAAHLLAELLENATIFSEPETPVEVKTGVIGEFVVVQVLDHGLGMSDQELEAANIKIRSTAASDALGAQRLGLFVVGRLSHRLGAEVRLAKSQRGTGTVTTVRFPVTLFAATEGPAYGSTQQSPPALTASSEPVQERSRPVQDEAPVVEPVNLAALTDGATSLGLPRRRLRDDDSGELPLAGSLPKRSAKTFDEDNIVLPAPTEARLSPELSAEGTGWTPAIAAAPSAGLPSRSRAATPAWQEPEEAAPPATPAPSAPAERAGLFTGFRGRTEMPGTDLPRLSPRAAAEALAAPAAPAPEQPVAPPPADAPPQRRSALGFEIPGLVPDAPEGEETQVWTPSWNDTAETAYEEPASTHVAEPEQAPAPQWSTPTWDEPAETPAWNDPTPAPAASWGQPAQEPTTSSPSWDEPAAEPAAPSWEQTTPAWEQPEPVASAAPVEEPVAPSPQTAYPDFTAYSGYTGWANPVDEARPAPQFTSPYSSTYAPAPSTSGLDESRAWAAGESDEQPAEQAPAWEPTQAYQAPTFEAPAYEAPAPVQDVAPQAQPWQEDAPAESLWSAPEQAAEPAWQQPAAPQPTAPQWEETPAAPVADAPWQPTVVEEGAPAWDRRRSAAQPEPVEASWSQPVPELVEDEPAQVYRDRDSYAQTEMFTPVEAEAVAEAHAVEPVIAHEPTVPTWAPSMPMSTGPAPAFTDLVQGDDDDSDDSKGRRRWSLFGRKKADGSPESRPTSSVPSFHPDPPAPPAQPAPGTFAPRQSAWSTEQAEPAATPAPGLVRRSSVTPPAAESSGWTPPPTLPEEPAAAAQPPQQVSSFFRPQGPAATAPASWTPPEWSGRGPAAPAAGQPPAPRSAPPSAAPRIGALDDEVAAMLALRSDIQEQALSELSQLSAYRPSAVNGSTGSASLTKRVPVAIPESPPLVTQEATGATGRDADQLRTRLSSFQSGTSRGRRAAEAPIDSPNRHESDPLVDQDQNNPSSPTW